MQCSRQRRWSRRRVCASQPAQHCRLSICAGLSARAWPNVLRLRASQPPTTALLPPQPVLPAPFRCSFMHVRLHRPSCATHVRTRALTARHTQCSLSLPIAGPCRRLARVAAKGNGWGDTHSLSDTWMMVSSLEKRVLVCRDEGDSVAWQAFWTQHDDDGKVR